MYLSELLTDSLTAQKINLLQNFAVNCEEYWNEWRKSRQWCKWRKSICNYLGLRHPDFGSLFLSGTNGILISVIAKVRQLQKLMLIIHPQ